jgi:hypothetical protein
VSLSFFGFRELWPSLSPLRKIAVATLFIGLLGVWFLMIPSYLYVLIAGSRYPVPDQGYIEALPLLSGTRVTYVTSFQKWLFFLSVLLPMASLSIMFSIGVFYLIKGRYRDRN